MVVDTLLDEVDIPRFKETRPAKQDLDKHMIPGSPSLTCHIAILDLQNTFSSLLFYPAKMFLLDKNCIYFCEAWQKTSWLGHCLCTANAYASLWTYYMGWHINVFFFKCILALSVTDNDANTGKMN